LQRVKVSLANGSNKRIRVCTQCIRSGAVVKAIRSAPFKLPEDAPKADKAAPTAKGAKPAKSSAGAGAKSAKAVKK
jgi:large subunit ribosomal protein L28